MLELAHDKVEMCVGLHAYWSSTWNIANNFCRQVTSSEVKYELQTTVQNSHEFKGRSEKFKTPFRLLVVAKINTPYTRQLFCKTVLF
jgi:hypothetical protein